MSVAFILFKNIRTFLKIFNIRKVGELFLNKRKNDSREPVLVSMRESLCSHFNMIVCIYQDKTYSVI